MFLHPQQKKNITKRDCKLQQTSRHRSILLQMPNFASPNKQVWIAFKYDGWFISLFAQRQHCARKTAWVGSFWFLTPKRREEKRRSHSNSLIQLHELKHICSSSSSLQQTFVLKLIYEKEEKSIACFRSNPFASSRQKYWLIRAYFLSVSLSLGQPSQLYRQLAKLAERERESESQL